MNIARLIFIINKKKNSSSVMNNLKFADRFIKGLQNCEMFCGGIEIGDFWYNVTLNNWPGL